MPKGTNRDMQTAEQLKAGINLIRKQLGWSYTFLAEVIASYDDSDEVDLSKFTEKLKKQLQRDTTSVELLDGYLKIIKNHPHFCKTNRIIANPIRLEAVDLSVLRAVQEMGESFLFDRDND